MGGMVCAKYEELIKIMVDSCLTPTQLAQTAGVSVSAVYRFRMGYLVRMDVAGKICSALGISCEEVLDFERMEKYRKEQANRYAK